MVNNEKPVDNSTVFLGELSLTGKIRNIQKIDLRIKEANKFGVSQIVLPKNKNLQDKDNIKTVNEISSAIKQFF